MLRHVDVPQGRIAVHDQGTGPTLLFVGGLLVDHALWDLVVERLEGRYRCVRVVLPLGAHREPMRPGSDLSPRGLAAIVAAVMEDLDLRDVVLVGNDTGGAICQLVVDRHGDRLAALILTTCDAYNHFPPPLLRPLSWLPKAPRLGHAVLRSLRFGPALTAVVAPVNKRRSRERMHGWRRSLVSDEAVRDDVLRFLAAIDTQDTVDAVPALEGFGRPALVVWSDKDVIFPIEDGRRLAGQLSAELRVVEDTRTFIALDQPGPLAEIIDAFVTERVAPPASAAASGA
jgi:pimeloyl-ACP methyl ester carboxylesterase